MSVGEETDSQTCPTEASSLLAVDCIVCVDSSFVPRFLSCLKANEQRVPLRVVIGRWREESMTVGVSECECEERG